MKRLTCANGFFSLFEFVVNSWNHSNHDVNAWFPTRMLARRHTHTSRFSVWYHFIWIIHDFISTWKFRHLCPLPFTHTHSEHFLELLKCIDSLNQLHQFSVSTSTSTSQKHCENCMLLANTAAHYVTLGASVAFSSPNAHFMALINRVADTFN